MTDHLFLLVLFGNLEPFYCFFVTLAGEGEGEKRREGERRDREGKYIRKEKRKNGEIQKRRKQRTKFTF